MTYPIEYTDEEAQPFEFVPVPATAEGLCPEAYRGRIAIDTVHDGHHIPRRLLESPRVAPLIQDGRLWQDFVIERDWGANLVAEHLARRLGVPGYHKVTSARLVMDFNRFPGSSPPDATPMNRLAIIEPFASRLDHDEKRYILSTAYDAVSQGFEAVVLGKLIKISVHTYDARNASRTERPEVSIITRSLSYQLNSQLPFGLFDPLFPDILAESSCNSILRDRISITLEKAGVAVEHNYPYCAPDGSLEVRSQPWFFFQHVRAQFEDRLPETRSEPAYEMVWNMLFNTNLRDGNAEALRGYLHRFRNPPEGHEDAFVAARDAYGTIADFCREHPSLITNYRKHPDRTSAISIEVRKDTIFRFDKGEPVEPREDKARAVAELVAEAIGVYLHDDLPAISTEAL